MSYSIKKSDIFRQWQALPSDTRSLSVDLVILEAAVFFFAVCLEGLTLACHSYALKSSLE